MKQHKTLVHLHTDYSFDCNISPEAMVEFALRNNFRCLAITDHDTTEGARRTAALAEGTGVKIVIGEEVSTRDGHLIGLFLERCIKPGMSARDTAIAIRDQGGLVLVPHPFVKLFGCGLCDAVWDIVDLIDAVEINNAQNIVSGPDREADRFARSMGLARYVGSDSHVGASIAPCYQHMRDFSGPVDFADALATAELRPGRHPLWYFAWAAYRTAQHNLGYALPEGFGANYRPDPTHGLVAIDDSPDDARSDHTCVAA